MLLKFLVIFSTFLYCVSAYSTDQKALLNEMKNVLASRKTENFLKECPKVVDLFDFNKDVPREVIRFDLVEKRQTLLRMALDKGDDFALEFNNDLSVDLRNYDNLIRMYQESQTKKKILVFEIKKYSQASPKLSRSTSEQKIKTYYENLTNLTKSNSLKNPAHIEVTLREIKLKIVLSMKDLDFSKTQIDKVETALENLLTMALDA